MNTTTPPGFYAGLAIAVVLAVLLWPRSADKGATRVIRRVVFNGWGILSAIFIAVALILGIIERLQ